MASYTRNIFQNTIDSHQTSPGWVLTFIQWANRDTLNYKTIPANKTYTPMVVQSDCIDLLVNSSKETLTPSANITLKGTDTDYSAAIAPGDFLFINILNWQTDADNVALKAASSKPINTYTDGFKGMFKVQSVRRALQTDPNGSRILVYRITAYGFTEFNNTIYFNPYLTTQAEKNNDFLFITRISNQWNSIVKKKGIDNCQDLVKLLVQAFIGIGLGPDGTKLKGGLLRSSNQQFFMPSVIGQLLGLKNVKFAADIYQLLFGVQQYASSTAKTTTPNSGFAPDTTAKVSGQTILKAEYWNQVKLWSIMSEYSNSVINEMYTTFRVNSSGNILPTVVLRQKPFTTEHFYNKNKKLKLTRFFNLPRWNIDPELIYNFDLGRDDVLRINFVQVFGRSVIPNSDAAISAQIGLINYVYDIDDVRRNGLRPYIPTSNYDFPDAANAKGYLAPVWAKMVADWVINGHLKENGTVYSYGIEEPICPGDNFQLTSWVFHIESVQHHCQVLADGTKTFRTILTLSHGMDESSSLTQPYYNEMDDTSVPDMLDFDWNGNGSNSGDKIYPGITESQATNTHGANAEDGTQVSQTFVPNPNKNKGKK